MPESFTLVACIVISALLLTLILVLAFRHLRACQKLRRQGHYDALLHLFINASRDIIYLKDENLCYLFVNTAFEKAFNVKEEKIIGKDGFMLGDRTLAERWRDRDLQTLQADEELVTDIDRAGAIYEVTNFPVPLSSGKTGVGAIIRNVTLLRQAEVRQRSDMLHNEILLKLFSLPFNNINDQLDFVLQQIIAIIGCRYGCIYRYNQKEGILTHVSCAEHSRGTVLFEGQQKKYRLNQAGLLASAISQATPIIINDMAQYASISASRYLPQGFPMPSRLLVIPVIIDNQVLAVLALGDKSTGFNADDVHEITLLTGGVWQAIKRKTAETQLTIERNRYRQTLTAIEDGVILIDSVGKVQELNPAAEKLIGWSHEEARGRHYSEIFYVDDEDKIKNIDDPVDQVIRTGQARNFDSVPFILRNNSKRFLESSIAPIPGDAGRLSGFVIVFRDVTRRQIRQQHIEFLSFHDSLTELYNRRFFEEELERLDTKRNWPIAIIMCDINGLKLTNDVFGHAAGDELLKGFAAVLNKVCRSDDILARWGGDEFVLLLPNTTCAEAETIISRIKNAYANRQFTAMRGSASLGAACKMTDEDGDIKQVLALAEERMYLNKAVEGDSVQQDIVGTIVNRLHGAGIREREHAETVSILCERLGKRLGLPQEEVRRARDAGYLHDIGKVVLDPKLLNKNYVMSEEDWLEIKKHPIVGYRILNTFDETIDLAEPVLAHQEHWDGSGYPKGLKGEEIPLLARIIALAEGYERLIHDSDHREAFSKDQAINHIRSLSGSQYEPALVSEFIQMV